MELNEAQKKILQAVKEARKLLQKEDSVSDVDAIATGNSVSPIGITPETSERDQVGLNRAELAKKKNKKSLKEKKPTKAIVQVPAGEKPPKGFVQVKRGIKLAVDPDAITNPEKFIADKHKTTP